MTTEDSKTTKVAQLFARATGIVMGKDGQPSGVSVDSRAMIFSGENGLERDDILTLLRRADNFSEVKIHNSDETCAYLIVPNMIEKVWIVTNLLDKSDKIDPLPFLKSQKPAKKDKDGRKIPSNELDMNFLGLGAITAIVRRIYPKVEVEKKAKTTGIAKIVKVKPDNLSPESSNAYDAAKKAYEEAMATLTKIAQEAAKEEAAKNDKPNQADEARIKAQNLRKVAGKPA